LIKHFIAVVEDMGAGKAELRSISYGLTS